MLKRIIETIKKSKQFNNLVIYGFGQGFNLITPLLVVPYIVSICGEEGYGKIGVGMAVAFFIMVFIDYGSEIIGVKDVAVNREDKTKLESIFITTYVAKFLLLLTMLFFTTVLFNCIPYFSKEKTLFFLSLSMVVGQFVNPTWFLQGVEDFKWITILNILSKAIYLVGVFLFLKQPSDYIYSNLIWGIGMITANAIACMYIVLKYSFSFFNLKKDDVSTLIIQNFTIFSSQIFVSLQMYSPIVLISFFGGNILAGQFKIVDQIIVIFKTYLLLFFNFVYPRVCYLLDKSKKEALRFWKIYNGLNGIFIISCMVIVAVFSIKIVTYFNPKGITEISKLLKMAVLIPIFQCISIPLKQLVLGANKKKEYVKTTMLITIISLAAVVAVTPFYHVFGVLFSLIITEIITALIFYRIIKKDLFVETS